MVEIASLSMLLYWYCTFQLRVEELKFKTLKYDIIMYSCQGEYEMLSGTGIVLLLEILEKPWNWKHVLSALEKPLNIVKNVLNSWITLWICWKTKNKTKKTKKTKQKKNQTNKQNKTKKILTKNIWRN